MTGTPPSIFEADEFWCLDVAVCACVRAFVRLCFLFCFLTSFLMALAFVTATILWTDFFREWSAMRPSSSSWITSALRGRGLLGARWALCSCGHCAPRSPLSIKVPCPLTQLCEIFSTFILVRLVFQLPENLDVIYKFEISLY